MEPYIEHISISVSDLDKAIEFIQLAFPSFKIRYRGITPKVSNEEWVHIGTDTTYIALKKAQSLDLKRKNYSDIGINHIGFVVTGIEQIADRLLKAGYKRSAQVLPHPYRKRDYFIDDDGNEYEFIEYISEIISERNDYEN